MEPEITTFEVMDELQRTFDTEDILDAVGDLDELRYIMADDARTFQPPEVRQQLLQLHRLAMKVVNRRDNDLEKIRQLYYLACEIAGPLSVCVDHLRNILRLLYKIEKLGRCDDLAE